MTQEEIVEMARESGMELYGLGRDRAKFVHYLVAFANLVAAKALAQLEQEQEPVATVENNSQQWKGMDGAIAFHLIERHADNWSDARKMMEEWLSANTTPPQRTWHGLTHEEIDYIYTGIRAVHHDVDSDVLCRAIEAKLKEKNT